jgi:3',5'-cyclic AMP phosphodiesterase CpdA
MSLRRCAVLCLGMLATAAAADLPLKQDSVRFAVIGDMGTGDKPQYEIAAQMEASREKTKFDFVLTLGDNIYGDKDMKKKFEDPYKPLLDAGLKFYASLGNHDNPNERFYKPFNMSEKRYYNFKKGNAEFFALDSNYMDPEQLAWLDKALHDSSAAWKICYFHHPLYSDGKFHGPDTDLRARLEPVLQAGGVRLVLTGHEHLYERIKPHNGIYYFVLGNSGELRPHGLKPSSDTASGFDTDRDFMVMEIAGDELYFQTIARTGETIDSGTIDRK